MRWYRSYVRGDTSLADASLFDASDKRGYRVAMRTATAGFCNLPRSMAVPLKRS